MYQRRTGGGNPAGESTNLEEGMKRLAQPALVAACLILMTVMGAAFAQEPLPDATAAAGVSASPAGPPAAAGAAPPQTLDLWTMIQQGGTILWIIMALSVFTVGMAVYLLLTVSVGREAPSTFIKRALAQLENREFSGAYQMCEDRNEMVAVVLRAGLKVAGHERYVVQEAMESEGERCATALWQKISYLNNVGAIAPLLGLLGTVWGMIGAFGAMAFNDATARSLTMAYSVAQAMVTTAAGLMLAIPALVIYYYLRGRVIQIVARVEALSTEFVEHLERDTV